MLLKRLSMLTFSSTVITIFLATLMVPVGMAYADDSDECPRGSFVDLPPAPYSYFGSAFMVDVVASDGSFISAKIGKCKFGPVVVKDGKYNGLVVSPPNSSFGGATITFHIDNVSQALETDVFISQSWPPTTKKDFDLNFPKPIPTPTPVPTPTPIPTSTPTPEPAPLIIFSGSIVVSGASMPEKPSLVARIGSMEFPAFVYGDSYKNLVIMPEDITLLGKQIEFFLNDFKSTISVIYEKGPMNRQLMLIFVGMPTATAVPPTATAVPPPTATAAVPPPTATAVPPPTATAVPPTATAVPPTATAVPPIATFVPAIATAVPPTATAVVPPTPTAVPPTDVVVSDGSSGDKSENQTSKTSSGGCSLLSGLSLSSGLANVLLLIAPVGMVVGYRRAKKSGLFDWM